MADLKKILVISHGHPDYSKGGGEIAAYNLHGAIDADPNFESVFFARHDQPSIMHGGTAFTGTGRANEVLFHSSMPDWFQFSQPDKPRVWRDFRELLETCQPDVVHFHHYVHLGIELIREVKNYSADIPIVLTLHEFFGICHNHGQMVKKQDNALCYRASSSDCSACFPSITPQEFFLREQFIKSHFSLVDEFISPSEFLIERYVEWGLPREKMRMIENLMEDRDNKNDTLKSDVPKSADSKLRLSFFGQINDFKGIDVLLDAVMLLPVDIREQVLVEINGSGLEGQTKILQRTLKEKFEATEDTVRMRGAYDFSELPVLMAASDWVVVPSKWWENSPMVILEARKYGVPVICSNIGGMAEKIVNGETGLHFMARRADSLAEKIIWVVNNQDKRERFAENIHATFNPKSSVQKHLSLYNEMMDSKFSDEKADQKLRVA